MRTASQYEIVIAICELSIENSHKKELQLRLLNLAADAAGIPVDNVNETGACNEANDTGEWPFWGYCRDNLFEHLIDEVTAETMAAILMAWNDTVPRNPPPHFRTKTIKSNCECPGCGSDILKWSDGSYRCPICPNRAPATAK